MIGTEKVVSSSQLTRRAEEALVKRTRSLDLSAWREIIQEKIHARERESIERLLCQGEEGLQKRMSSFHHNRARNNTICKQNWKNSKANLEKTLTMRMDRENRGWTIDLMIDRLGNQKNEMCPDRGLVV